MSDTDRPLLFLDCDGVLNAKKDKVFERGGPLIKQSCVAALNYIIAKCSPEIVISSSWRYMIIKGAMTTTGFGHMLYTHGVIGASIIGHTLADELISTRGEQIDFWMRDNHQPPCYLVIDDEAFDIEQYGHPFLRTNGDVGLTMKDARKAVRMLKER